MSGPEDRKQTQKFGATTGTPYEISWDDAGAIKCVFSGFSLGVTDYE